MTQYPLIMERFQHPLVEQEYQLYCWCTLCIWHSRYREQSGERASLPSRQNFRDDVWPLWGDLRDQFLHQVDLLHGTSMSAVVGPKPDVSWRGFPLPMHIILTC
jgi:hypothetical protein